MMHARSANASIQPSPTIIKEIQSLLPAYASLAMEKTKGQAVHGFKVWRNGLEKVEFQIMTHGVYQLLWLKVISEDLRIK